MNPDRIGFMGAIEELAKQGEGPNLEFKQSVPKDLAKTICGMANASGGTILLGVRDNGSIEGFDADNKTIADIENLGKSCDPLVRLSVQKLGECLAIRVEESHEKPVLCKQGYFIRNGTLTERIPNREVQRLRALYYPMPFDSVICEKFGFPEDFDDSAYEAWRSFLPRASAQMSAEEMLPRIGAAEQTGGEIRLTNAAVLMFAKEPQRFISECPVTYLLFNGSEGTRIVKREEIAKPIPFLLDSVEELLERHMNNAYILTGKIRREEVPEYPLEAVREALVNAVVHRDWNLSGANVFAELHGDKLLVKSPGGFPLGVNEENLDSSCVRRNEHLADLMQRGKIIEKAGTGITRMRKECERSGNPPPEISDIGDLVIAAFKPNPKATRSDSLFR